MLKPLHTRLVPCPVPRHKRISKNFLNGDRGRLSTRGASIAIEHTVSHYFTVNDTGIPHTHRVNWCLVRAFGGEDNLNLHIGLTGVMVDLVFHVDSNKKGPRLVAQP